MTCEMCYVYGGVANCPTCAAKKPPINVQIVGGHFNKHLINFDDDYKMMKRKFNNLVKQVDKLDKILDGLTPKQQKKLNKIFKELIK